MGLWNFAGFAPVRVAEFEVFAVSAGLRVSRVLRVCGIAGLRVIYKCDSGREGKGQGDIIIKPKRRLHSCLECALCMYYAACTKSLRALQTNTFGRSHS